MMKGKTSYHILSVLISAVLFGAAAPACKLLVNSYNPFLLAGLLYFGAAAGVFPSFLWRKPTRFPWNLDRKNLLRLIGAVGFGGVLGPVFLLLGLRFAPAASVSMWLNLELVATVILGYLIFHDYLGKRGWLGVFGVVIASVVLGMGEKTAGAGAGLLVALACFCWGLDNHFTALVDGITPAQSTFWKGLIAGTVNLFIGVIIGSYARSITSTIFVILIGVFSYGVSIVLYITAAQNIGATRSQMIFASAPFFGVLLAAGWLEELISVNQLMAALVFISSLFILFLDRHVHIHSHEEISHEHNHHHNDMHHEHVHLGHAPANQHCHWHKHPPKTHSHPHWPDLHHRHKHLLAEKVPTADD